MVLAIDIGNTNIVVGAIKNEEILFIERISTNKIKTELEFAIDLRLIMDIHKIDIHDFHGAIISSVVPQVTGPMRLAVEKICPFSPLVVGPGLKTGLNIMLDNPAEIGSDRVADAVAAISEYKAPIVIIDMGTANTISVIDKDKRLIGGLIMPGVRVSLDALTSRASQLSGISIENPKRLIGKNTIDCMKSGIIFGNAAMIDGLISRLEEELGEKPTIIATGGLSKLIIPHCEHKIIRDENLLLKGLNILYNKNAR